MAGSNREENSQLLTLKEFSDISKLSPATIHRLKQQGKIPYFQPSGPRGKLLFPADAVEQAANAVSNNSFPASSGTEKKAHLSGPCPIWMKF
ncbi:MAG: helix-turn-helix domain-containing protein [Planctomycetota bacterium]